MNSQEGPLRCVAWRDLFPCLLLVRTLRLSLRFSVLLLAVAGFFSMSLGEWFIGDILFARTEDPLINYWRSQDAGIGDLRDSAQSQSSDESTRLAAMNAAQTEVPGGLDERAVQRPHGWISAVSAYVARAALAPAHAFWHLVAPVVRTAHADTTWQRLSYLLLSISWNTVTWALFGGAIARIAAFEFTRREPLGWSHGIAQAAQRFPAHVMAPVVAGIATFIAASPLIVLGVVIRLEAMAWIAGILWLGVLLIGLLVAVLALGLVAGWPLMWAAIAVEHADPFEAVSRSYAYVYQRPLHLIAYVIWLTLLATLGTVAIHVFADATVVLADVCVSWGSGAENLSAIQGSPSESTGEPSAFVAGAAAGRQFWMLLLDGLRIAYPLGFLWCAAVGAYLLLRLHIDEAQPDEMVVDDLHTGSDLPPLTPHASGVPDVASRPVDA